MNTFTLAVKGDNAQFMAECLAACKACLEACVLCFSACQSAELEAFAEKCLACAQACRKCILACESGDMAATMAACQALAALCDACKASCAECQALCLAGGLNDCAAACSVCAEACVRCSAACARMMAMPMPGKRFLDEVEAALVAVGALSKRAASLADMRAKEGRKMSAESQDRIKHLAARLLSLEATLKGAANDDEAQVMARVELGRALRAGLK